MTLLRWVRCAWALVVAWGRLIRCLVTILTSVDAIDRFIAGCQFGPANLQSDMAHLASAVGKEFERRHYTSMPVELIFMDANEAVVIGTRLEAPHRRDPVEYFNGSAYAASRHEGTKFYYRQVA